MQKSKNSNLEPRIRYKLEERTLLILEVLVYQSPLSITMYVNLKIKIDQFESDKIYVHKASVDPNLLDHKNPVILVQY